MKVLVIDDSSTQRKILKKVLREFGFFEDSIIEAEDGDVAIEILGKNYKDIGLILCDWIMPRLSGVDFVEAIGKVPHLKGIPAVIVSVESGDDKIQEAYRRCPHLAGYLAKPFSAEQLKKFIDETMEFRKR